jgi:diadenosine tetraphosphate (Ap4A) HIT family hydrolase
MALIYKTENFVLESFETPHVTREDGGHLRIYPKKEILDRTEMSPAQAVEFIRLTMISGTALKRAMNNRGIEIARINYQEMGNWAFKTNKKPFFHLHIYGRAKNAKYQPYTESVYLPDRSTGFYNSFQPLDNEDVDEIKKQIKSILKEKKYLESNWKLSIKK